MERTGNKRWASRDNSLHVIDTNRSDAKSLSKYRKPDDLAQFYAPIPRPTTPLGFRGIRRKPAEFDSRSRVRHSN